MILKIVYAFTIYVVLLAQAHECRATVDRALVSHLYQMTWILPLIVLNILH